MHMFSRLLPGEGTLSLINNGFCIRGYGRGGCVDGRVRQGGLYNFSDHAAVDVNWDLWGYLCFIVLGLVLCEIGGARVGFGVGSGVALGFGVCNLSYFAGLIVGIFCGGTDGYNLIAVTAMIFKAFSFQRTISMIKVILGCFKNSFLYQCTRCKCAVNIFHHFMIVINNV